MKIDNRQQFLVILAAAAVALYVAVNFVYEPLSSLWSARQQQIRDLKDKITDGKRLIRNETAMRKQWSDWRANSLPNNKPLAFEQVYKAINNWSQGTGAEISSIMPQWKDDSTNYMTLNCRVEAAGNLGSLSQFLYNIEKGPAPLKLDSVELSAHDNAGQQFTLGLQISGLAFLQDNKK